MSRFLGFFGLVLGLVGLLACMAAVAGVWWFSQKYLNQAAETVKAVETLLASSDERFGRLRTGVNETSKQVAALKERVHAVVKEGDRANPAFKARVEELIDLLDSKLARAEDVAQLLSSGAGLVSFVSDNKSADEVKKVEEAVTKSVTTLEDVRKKLVVAREDKNIEATAQSIDDLASRLGTILNEVVKGVGEVDGLLQKSRNEIAALNKTVVFWKDWGPWIVTGVLVWLALGQFALLAWGWTWLRAPAVESGGA